MQTLTLADEIVVLMLDDPTGEVRLDCRAVADIAIAGGLLMELALRGRIDTDLQSLFLVDAAPVGDELLDLVLREVAAAPVPKPSTWWIEQLGSRQGGWLDQILARLVGAGVLREEDRTFLWVFSKRAYPPVSGREEREAKGRLLSVLFSDDIPDPRDTLLLGLADACGVLSLILTEAEVAKAARRIAQVVSLEEIGRAVAAVTTDIRVAMGSMVISA
jgi:Golgi phosphoprotein 3